MNVFDSSALLAYIRKEPGAEVTEAALIAGGTCGAANWSEVAQKVTATGYRWAAVSRFLRAYPFTIEPVTRIDAEWAAARWRAGEGLSLGDRLCLALGERLDATVWTANGRWGESGRIRQIR